MRKILLIVVVLLSSLTRVMAADLDPIAQTKAVLDQYSARVKYLETENAILREEMRKAGIQIPLSIFSGAIQSTPSTPVVNNTATGILATGSTAPSSSTADEVSFSYIEKTYGTSYAGFIKRINSEWDKVRAAYAMPKDAYIGGYEFVLSGALDHVFVDITYSGSLSATGIYDAKVLYQFDKTTFARKLIGFFEHDDKTGFYVTKTGKNIFPGVKRTWVTDPRSTVSLVPATVNSNTGTTTPIATPTSTSTGTTPVTFADIDAAYTAKRFLSVISLSNTWLTANAPTLDVLRIRYRTYFIIAKYTEALKEIEKIRSIGQLSSAVACEANIIATYAKDTTLAASYKTTCNAK